MKIPANVSELQQKLDQLFVRQQKCHKGVPRVMSSRRVMIGGAQGVFSCHQ